MAILSKREEELVEDLITGLASKEIAAKNFISIHTVNTHFKTVKRKLNARNNVEVAIKYLKALEDPAKYLKELTLVFMFLVLQGFTMVAKPDMQMRRPPARARITRTVKTKIV